MKNAFKMVDEIMLGQLEELNKLDPNDKDFMKKQQKAKTIALIADKIIQSNVSQLKRDIWEKSRMYGMAKKQAIAQASGIEYEELEYDECGA